MLKFKSVVLLVFAVLFFVAIVLGVHEYVLSEPDSDISFEINEKSDNLQDGFMDNQRISSKILTDFYDGLKQKYGICTNTHEYSVNGLSSDSFPDYFAGTYVNTNGELIVQITDKYYVDNYRSTDWYKEFVALAGNDKFYCHPVKYSYSELIEAISDITLGGMSMTIKGLGASIIDAGINDYTNTVEIHITERDYEYVKGLLTSDIYSVIVGDYQLNDSVGLYPGEGVSLSVIGDSDFSGLQKGFFSDSTGVVLYSYFTKMSNALDVLQGTGSIIPVYTY